MAELLLKNSFIKSIDISHVNVLNYTENTKICVNAAEI